MQDLFERFPIIFYFGIDPSFYQFDQFDSRR
jgi:hypothetical protein